MQSHVSTTPFGRRLLSLAHVASQATAKARPPDKAVHKWQVFRAICTAKARIGVSERALAVLDALLSFHPETTLSGEGLIVFPSNQQLALRAHGMAAGDAATASGSLGRLRPHHSARQPERQALRPQRAGRGDRMAFGFDLSPLVARAAEFEAWAEDVQAEERTFDCRERITLCRRDIAKMIATGIEEGVPPAGQGRGLRIGPRSTGSIAASWSGFPARLAGGARADRGRSDAAGRRNPHPVGKSRKNIKFKRQ